MARVRVVNVETEQARQELRLRIARLRRRIDARLVSLRDESRDLASWRTCVRRWPIPSLLAALAGGWLVAAGLGRGGWTWSVGRRLSGLVLGQIAGSAWKTVVELWQAASRSGNDHA